MNITRRVHFGLRAYGKKTVAYQIRMRVSYAGVRDDYITGCNLVSPKDWLPEFQRVRAGAVGVKGEGSAKMNATLSRFEDVIEGCFKYFEVNGIVPEKEALRQRFEMQMEPARTHAGEVPPQVPAGPALPDDQDVYAVLDLFVAEEGQVREWTPATYQKLASLKTDLGTFRPCLRFEDLTKQTLADFVRWLREEKVLRTPRKKLVPGELPTREDVVGLLNTSIEKKLFLLKWFLNWATERGYNHNLAYKHFNPRLKQTRRPVIYLTKEELGRLNALRFSPGQRQLEQARDCFLFQCFSGLRWSDLNLLRRGDVGADCIQITTEKTEDSLTIELNNVTRRILDKYKEVSFPHDRALPVPTNQKMNILLKEICRMAGIDTPVRITRYRGQERIDTYHPKYELIGTHAGRRTFTTQSLSRGIPAEIVMKWTGHKDYRSMKPYIDVVDDLKAKAMKKLDDMGL